MKKRLSGPNCHRRETCSMALLEKGLQAGHLRDRQPEKVSIQQSPCEASSAPKTKNQQALTLNNFSNLLQFALKFGEPPSGISMNFKI